MASAEQATTPPGDQGGDGGVVLTLRLIRSFPHRNIRHLVLPGVDPGWTAGDLLRRCLEAARTNASLPPPFRNFAYDAMKIEHQAHGAKTSDPVINRGDDDRLLLSDLSRSLDSYGVKNETAISLFRMQDYQEYKANPSVAW